MGLKGSGKTRRLLEIVEEAVEKEQGDTVFIEASSKLIHDVPQKVRLIDASQYDFSGYDFIKGYISGLYCSNYDITHIFIDSLLKIAHSDYGKETDEFVCWCEEFGNKEDINFTFSVSEDVSKASDAIKRYI